MAHDVGLVTVAVAICAIGSFVTARLLQRVFLSAGKVAFAWAMIGAVAAGCTMWSTHFVAMLAYEPGVVATYDAPLTMLSLLLGVVGSVVAFAIATLRGPAAVIAAGAAFGSSVALMHYSGMAAVKTSAEVRYAVPFVALSVAVGLALSVLAFRLIAASGQRRTIAPGAVGLALSVIGLHVVGMSAITIHGGEATDGGVIGDAMRTIIAFKVAGVCLLVTGIGAATYVIDGEMRARAASRLSHLMQSAVDGMAVARGDQIVDVNGAFERMTALPRDTLLGASIAGFVGLPEPEGLQEGVLLTTTLVGKDGTKLPVELVVRTERAVPSEAPLTVYALRDISQRLAQERKILTLLRDPLTGLFNRASFQEQAARIHPPGTSSPLCLIAIDLDKFKDANDKHGHAAGDEVMRVVGKRLRTVLHEETVCARMGGDEFAVVASIATRDDAVRLAEMLQRTISETIPFGGLTLQCEASVGVALCPDDGSDLDELWTLADRAMYRAKGVERAMYRARGAERAKVCYYDASIDDGGRAHRTLIGELRHAIEHGGLELSYEPQHCVATGEPFGYEVRPRWSHPTRGLLDPGEFIPLAQETGLIVQLGAFVLRTALREASRWPNEAPVLVKASAAELADRSFVDTVEAAIHAARIDPSRVCIAVGESWLIADPDRARHVLTRLKAVGVALAIDDFGAAYANLSAFEPVAFDRLKITASLGEGIEFSRQSVGTLGAALSLAAALGVPVIAEGTDPPVPAERTHPDASPPEQDGEGPTVLEAPHSPARFDAAHKISPMRRVPGASHRSDIVGPAAQRPRALRS